MRFRPLPSWVSAIRRAIGILLCGGLILGCSGPQVGDEEEEREPPDRVYHVQLDMSEEKAQAVRVRSRAEQWWENQPASARPPFVRGASSSDRAVSIEWRAPFYRVRLGPFAQREQADSVLAAARPTFPDAFVAPERIGSE